MSQTAEQKVDNTLSQLEGFLGAVLELDGEKYHIEEDIKSILEDNPLSSRIDGHPKECPDCGSEKLLGKETLHHKITDGKIVGEERGDMIYVYVCPSCGKEMR